MAAYQMFIDHKLVSGEEGLVLWIFPYFDWNQPWITVHRCGDFAKQFIYLADEIFLVRSDPFDSLNSCDSLEIQVKPANGVLVSHRIIGVLSYEGFQRRDFQAVFRVDFVQFLVLSFGVFPFLEQLPRLFHSVVVV